MDAGDRFIGANDRSIDADDRTIVAAAGRRRVSRRDGGVPVPPSGTGGSPRRARVRCARADTRVAVAPDAATGSRVLAGMKNLIALLVAMIAASASAASPVLIPTLYAGPGAFGTRWNTAVVLNNHTTADFRSPGVTFGIICFIPEGCRSDTIPAGGFGDIASPHAANGLLLYLPDDQTDISFMARFAASPRNTLAGGADLPPLPPPRISLRPPPSPPLRVAWRGRGREPRAGRRCASTVPTCNLERPSPSSFDLGLTSKDSRSHRRSSSWGFLHSLPRAQSTRHLRN